jgi:hypothetical protein
VFGTTFSKVVKVVKVVVVFGTTFSKVVFKGCFQRLFSKVVFKGCFQRLFSKVVKYINTFTFIIE